jgi:predicted ATPase
MNKVVPLFAKKNAEILLSELETRIVTAVTSILAATGKLGYAVEDLSKQFEAIETAIDTVDDTETQNRLKELTKLSRETLSRALLKQSQQIGNLPHCRGV